jgi:hypothetical protein
VIVAAGHRGLARLDGAVPGSSRSSSRTLVEEELVAHIDRVRRAGRPTNPESMISPLSMPCR